jgi:hypothetical protein
MERLMGCSEHASCAAVTRSHCQLCICDAGIEAGLQVSCDGILRRSDLDIDTRQEPKVEMTRQVAWQMAEVRLKVKKSEVSSSLVRCGLGVTGYRPTQMGSHNL